jgi:ABC-type antimicrobial peptide transport system permease subunit
MIPFMIKYTLRQWRLHLMQSAVLLTGFSLCCAFLIGLIATAPTLFADREPWMPTEPNLVTIGLETQTGAFKPMTPEQLALFETSPAISNLMHISTGVQHVMANPEGERFDSPQFLFVSRNFIDTFAEQLPPAFAKLQGSEMIISHDFWVSENSSRAIDELVMNFPETDVSYPVEGVLPDNFSLFAGREFDVIMLIPQIERTFVVKFGSHDQVSDEERAFFTKELIKSANSSFGIAELKPGYTIDQVSPVRPETDEQSDKYSFVSHSSSGSWLPKVVKGVQFYPHQRNAVQRQWWMLFGLTGAFFVLTLFNLMTSNFSHYLQRLNEFQTRQAVGASQRDLYKQVWVENCVLGFVAAVSGVIGSHGLRAWLDNQMALVGEVSVAMGVAAAALSAVLIILVVTLLGSLPLVVLNKKAAFSRTKDNGKSRFQQLLDNCNMVVQVAFSFIAITAAVALWTAQSERLSSVPMDSQVQQVTYAKAALESSQVIVLDEWINDIADLDFEAAFSIKPVVESSLSAIKVDLKNPDSPSASTMQIMAVSDNYLSLLGVNPLAGARDPEQGNRVTINQSAAQALGFDNPSQAIGQRLYINNARSFRLADDIPIIVEGVIEDLPHESLNQSASPVVYNLAVSSVIALYQLNFIARGDNIAMLRAWLDSKSDASEGVFKVSQQASVRELLQQQDQQWFKLGKLVLALTLLVCGLAATGVYQHLMAYLIERSRRYAIMQAVGAQINDVLISVARSLLPKALLGLLLGGAALMSLNNWYADEFYAPLVTVQSLGWSLLGFSLLLLLSCAPAIYRQLSRPISRAIA